MAITVFSRLHMTLDAALSVGRFVRPLVGLSVCLSVGLFRAFWTAENARIMLDNEFQGPMKVFCERARTHAHLRMSTDAHTRSFCNYLSRAGLVSKLSTFNFQHSVIIALLLFLYFVIHDYTNHYDEHKLFLRRSHRLCWT